MAGVGFQELILLFVIGLLILGPERLPRVAAQLGRWVGKARRTANQLRYQMEREIALAEIDRAQSKKPRDQQSERGGAGDAAGTAAAGSSGSAAHSAAADDGASSADPAAGPADTGGGSTGDESVHADGAAGNPADARAKSSASPGTVDDTGQ